MVYDVVTLGIILIKQYHVIFVMLWYYFKNYFLDSIDINELNCNDDLNEQLFNVNKSNEIIVNNDVLTSGIILTQHFYDFVQYRILFSHF